MPVDRYARVAAVAGLGLALIAGLAWLVISGSDPGDSAGGALVTAQETAESPIPELPTPPDAQPLFVHAVEAAAAPVAPIDSGDLAPQASEAGPPRAELQVLVVDPRNRPVAGAEVAGNRGQPRRQRTDDEGLARIAAAPGETVGLAVRHDDHRFATASATLAPEPGSVTDVRIELGGGLQACLTVRSRDGRPIEGACVRVQEGWGAVDSKDCMVGSPEDLLRMDDHWRIRGRLQENRVTDAQGTTCVSGLRSGSLTVHVDAAGHVPLRSTRFELDADGGDLGVVVLEPAVKVAGIVEDAAGPVPDALVEVHSLDYWRTTTDADGSFAVDGLASLPARVELRASHPERGHFLAERLTLTAAPLRIALVPHVDVRLELRDAETRAPVEGDGTLERRTSGQVGLVIFPSSEKVVVTAGRLDIAGLPYYLTELSLKLAGYDELIVPMSSITADADGVLQLELMRPVPLLVRVRDADTGQPIADARLDVGQMNRDEKGRDLGRYWMLQTARFDAQAGGYVVSESELHVASGDPISLYVSAPGRAPSEAVPIAVAGRRTCPATIDVYLAPE